MVRSSIIDKYGTIQKYGTLSLRLFRVKNGILTRSKSKKYIFADYLLSKLINLDEGKNL